MSRKIISITGTRSDYGLMTPVFERIAGDPHLVLELIITGMHLLPEFSSSLEKIKEDRLCTYHIASMALAEDSGKAMAQSLGIDIFSIADLLAEVRPDMVLLQGDRGEMLAGAIAAAHMNLPIVHMSGGDFSGSIDDSIRNAISKFAHIHLTTCGQSTERLISMGENRLRIFEVGEPGIDLIKNMEFISPAEVAEEFNLDLSKPIILATQHPVTTEAGQGVWQISQTLEALEEIGIQTVFTYPNSDAGGKEMVRVLESYRKKDFIRIIPNLGSDKYLSLMKISSALVGNSSSGILEAPTFHVPVVNIGTRQHNRLRAANVVDADYNKESIKEKIRYVLHDDDFKKKCKTCTNPYGDGTSAVKTVDVLKRLIIKPSLLEKWFITGESFLM